MNWSEHFHKPQGLYLNTGSFSFMPKVVLERQIQLLRDFEDNPTEKLFQAWPKMWETQKVVSRLLGADPEDVFIRHNVTGSLNDFLLGVKLSPGSIAITDVEYGAIVNICKLRCSKENRELKVINIPFEPNLTSEESLIDELDRQIGPDVRMLMISHVITGTGLKIPIQKLADRLVKKGVILAIDGAQGAGSHSLKLNDLKNVHFYGGNFHKWFLGPKGTGFGWVPKWFQDQVEPIQGSWTIFGAIGPFQEFGNGNLFTAKMLASSCLSFPTFFALKDLTAWWEKFGAENIFSKIQDHRKKLEHSAQEAEVKILSPALDSLKSPLLTLALKKEFQSQPLELMKQLWTDHQLQVVPPVVRGSPTIRLSAHVYNDPSEFPKALKILKPYLEPSKGGG